MIDQAVAKKITSIIKRYKPDEGASFRNAFTNLTSGALQAAAISAEEASIISRLRASVERWTANEANVKPAAEWLEFYGLAKEIFPTSVFEALLSRLSRNDNADAWTSFILSSTDKALVTALVTRRLVTKGDLKRLAKSHPAGFLSSPALDILLDRGDGFSRSVWSGYHNVVRPTGLLPLENSLVKYFGADRAADAERWFIDFIRADPQLRSRVWPILLGDQESAIRATQQLLLVILTKAKDTTEAVQLATEWIQVCLDRIRQRATNQSTALLVVGMFRLSLDSARASDHRELNQALEESGEVLTEYAVESLQLAESGITPDESRALLVLRSSEIFGSFSKYLANLPGYTAPDQDPSRASRRERHLGRKELIEPLVDALHDAADGEALRDAIEVALFNAGVRAIGDEGEESIFDHHMHDSTESALIDGDPVIVVRPGRILGTMPDGIVLLKARVRAV